jgi:hypothetical protein
MTNSLTSTLWPNEAPGFSGDGSESIRSRDGLRWGDLAFLVFRSKKMPCEIWGIFQTDRIPGLEQYGRRYELIKLHHYRGEGR